MKLVKRGCRRLQQNVVGVYQRYADSCLDYCHTYARCNCDDHAFRAFLVTRVAVNWAVEDMAFDIREALIEG